MMHAAEESDRKEREETRESRQAISVALTPHSCVVTRNKATLSNERRSQLTQLAQLQVHVIHLVS